MIIFVMVCITLIGLLGVTLLYAVIVFDSIPLVVKIIVISILVLCIAVIVILEINVISILYFNL